VVVFALLASLIGDDDVVVIARLYAKSMMMI
jgi:hypothetical protein